MTMTDEQRARYVQALIREREMAEARGDQANVAEVNAELHRIGAQAAPPVKRAARRPRKKPEER